MFKLLHGRGAAGLSLGLLLVAASVFGADPAWDFSTGTVRACVEGGVKSVKISLPPGANEVGVLTAKPGWPVKPNTNYAVKVRLKSRNVPAGEILVTELNAKGDEVRAARRVCSFHAFPTEWDYSTHGFFTGANAQFVRFEVRLNACGQNQKKGMELLFTDFAVEALGPVPEVSEKGKEVVLDPGFEKCPAGEFAQKKETPDCDWVQHGSYVGKLVILADGQAQEGKQYLHSEAPKEGPSGISQMTRFLVPAGSLVRISFWVRGQGEVHASIGLHGTKAWLYAQEVTEKVSSPDRWKEVEGEFRVEDCASVQGTVNFYNFGSVDLDDYSVIVYPPKALPLPVVD